VTPGSWEHTFLVMGVPEPQGSARGFRGRGRRVIITSDNKDLPAWRQAVRYEAQRYVEHNGLTIYDRKHYALALALEFNFVKPVSAPKNLTRHNKRPDLDKLVRAVGDALTGVIMEDDSMVDELVVQKRYGDRPGVKVAFSAALIKQPKSGETDGNERRHGR